MKLKIVYMILFLVLLVSCAPKAFTPYKPPDLKLNETPPYSIKKDLDNLQSPDKLVPIYIKKTDDELSYIVVGSIEEGTHILLAPKEYAKVGAIVKLTRTYKEIVLVNETIINTYIDEINALKELSALEREKVISYRELWVNSKYEHKTDNMINRSGMYIISIGSILLLLLLL